VIDGALKDFSDLDRVLGEVIVCKNRFF